MGKDQKGRELGPGLSQRKDGYYSARFKAASGKRPEKYFKKLSEAKEWLYKAKYENERLYSENLTVDEWYQFWIKNYKENIRANNTVKNYKNRYEYNIKKKLGNMNLRDVKQLDCQLILNNMFNDGKYSYGTMELTQITMHAIFKAAVSNGYIKSNPAEGLELKGTPNIEERRVLTRKEQSDFLKYSELTQYHLAYALVLETGIRCGELGGLKWDDINFQQKRLYIRRTLLCDKEKEGFYTGVPKTPTSIRQVPLTDNAISILNKQRIQQNMLRYRSKNWDNSWSGLVFTTSNGRPVGGSTFNVAIRRILKQINLMREAESVDGTYEFFEPFTMHSLRHTFATRAMENGIPAKIIQKILGHSNLSTTMDLYVHATDEQLDVEIQKMNQIQNNDGVKDGVTDGVKDGVNIK